MKFVSEKFQREPIWRIIYSKFNIKLLGYPYRILFVDEIKFAIEDEMIEKSEKTFR